MLFWTALLLSGCQAQNNSGLELITSESNWYGLPTWYPDGSKMLYRSKIDSDHFVALDLESGVEEDLPIPMEGYEGIAAMDWISNTSLAYVAFPSSKTPSALIVHDFSQGSDQILFSSQEKIYDMCWSQIEEAFIFLMRKPVPTDPTVYGNSVMKYLPENATFSTLFQAREDRFITDITCSPDGDQVAVLEREGDSTGYITRLYIATTRYISKRLIFESSRTRLDEPSWSPDGQWMIFRTIDGVSKRAPRGIMLIAADGSETRRVDVPWPGAAPANIAWSPIGNTLLTRVASGLGINSYKLYLFDLSPWLDEGASDG